MSFAELEGEGAAGSEGTGTLHRAKKLIAEGTAGSSGFAYFEMALGQPCVGESGSSGAGFLFFDPPPGPALEDAWFYGATSVKDMVGYGVSGSSGEAELYT